MRSDDAVESVECHAEDKEIATEEYGEDGRALLAAQNPWRLGGNVTSWISFKYDVKPETIFIFLKKKYIMQIYIV